MTPSKSALMSMVTLSVSTNAITSSALTACPTVTNHSTIVPYHRQHQDQHRHQYVNVKRKSKENILFHMNSQLNIDHL